MDTEKAIVIGCEKLEKEYERGVGRLSIVEKL